MKTIVILIAITLSAFTAISDPIQYRFAVDAATEQYPVVIDSLLCSWDGSAITYTAKCHSGAFATAKRNVILRFTLAGTVSHSTADIAHGITLKNNKGGAFEIKGRIPYTFEPSMTFISAQHQDISGADESDFLDVKDKDASITKEVPHFTTLTEQLLIFSDGRQKHFN